MKNMFIIIKYTDPYDIDIREISVQGSAMLMINIQTLFNRSILLLLSNVLNKKKNNVIIPDLH